jgi:hypothetical protein
LTLGIYTPLSNCHCRFYSSEGLIAAWFKARHNFSTQFYCLRK